MNARAARASRTVPLVAPLVLVLASLAAFLANPGGLRDRNLVSARLLAASPCASLPTFCLRELSKIVPSTVGTDILAERAMVVDRDSTFLVHLDRSAGRAAAWTARRGTIGLMIQPIGWSDGTDEAIGRRMIGSDGPAVELYFREHAIELRTHGEDPSRFREIRATLPPGSLTPDRWHHIGASWDWDQPEDSGAWLVAVDGVTLRSAYRSQGSPTEPRTATSIGIGHNVVFSAHQAPGRYADIVVLDRPSTAEQLRRLSTASMTGSGPGDWNAVDGLVFASSTDPIVAPALALKRSVQAWSGAARDRSSR